MAKLDLTRLKADIKQSEEPRSVHPGGRRLTGGMEIDRDHLKDVEAVKASGKSCVVIAASVARQAVT